MQEITDQLIRHEGLRLTPYRCPAGRLTIGVGRNLEEKGISEQEAMVLLENDINECIADLQTLFDDDPARFNNLPQPVQNVLVDMRFNLGPNGFRSFTNMIRAIKENDFHTAALEMKDSRWFTQVGDRAETLVQMMKAAG